MAACTFDIAADFVVALRPLVQGLLARSRAAKREVSEPRFGRIEGVRFVHDAANGDERTMIRRRSSHKCRSEKQQHGHFRSRCGQMAGVWHSVRDSVNPTRRLTWAPRLLCRRSFTMYPPATCCFFS